jgi:hypothetical protein
MPAPQNPPSTSPDLARTAAVAFVARLQAKDVAGAVALSDAPFITHEQTTLKTIGEVKQYLETMTASVPPSEQPNAVLNVRA